MKSKALNFFLVTLLLLSGLSQVRAAVINAANGSFIAVSNAVASAAPGDTVLIPPGTNIWTGKLNMSGITLQGSGSTSTVIVDESPATGNGTPLIQINTISNALSRVTQLQFKRGITNTLPFQNYNGNILVYGASSRLRIDHCVFSYLTGKPIHIGGGENGLIDHCSFLMQNTANCIEVNGDAYGDASWASPSSFGTSNALYIEDNYIYSVNNFCAVDIDNGGRVVFRYNTMLGSFFNTHGTETGQRYRGSRQVEVYNNSFNWGGGLQYNNFYTGCDIRGGTGLIFSNTFVGFWSVANLNCYRATDNDQNFLPWFGATGLSGWDSNGPALLSGTATVTSNALVIPGAGWAANEWVGCTVYNYSNALCGLVTSSSADTIKFKTSRSSSLQINFKPGDTFTIHKIYPIMDQPGRGQGDMLPGSYTPTPVWTHQASEPVYVWSNSLSLMYTVPTTASPNVSSSYPTIQEGRDFFNAPKPGYTPFVYPHPLTLLTNAINNTNSVPPPPTNSPPATNTITLPQPTGVNVRGI
jgi:hypothetical protein